MADKPEEQYLQQVAIFNQSEQEALLKKKIALYESYKSYFFGSNKNNIVSKCQNLELLEPMVEDLLMKIDKNTMAFSIEGRVPFLDYRVVELAAQMPDKYKLSGLTKDKLVLRKAFDHVLPKQTSYQKKKHFFVPIDSWLDNHLMKLRHHLLSPEYLKKQGIFNPEYISSINKNLNSSKLFYARQLWALITFQIWYKRYIENEEVQI